MPTPPGLSDDKTMVFTGWEIILHFTAWWSIFVFPILGGSDKVQNMDLGPTHKTGGA